MHMCRWCGTVYDSLDHVDQAQDGSGFWCEFCDGFTFFSPQQNEEHRMLLILESGGTESQDQPAKSVPLRKRVSPLRYPGGKSKLIDYIFQRTQADQMDTFIEVFAGGASLGLSLLDAGRIRKLELNDADPMLHAFWETVLNDPAPLLRRIEERLPNHEDFWAAKAVMSACEKGEDILPTEMAWSFLLLNRTCFSGIVMANPLGGKNGTQEQLLVRWNPSSLQKRILRVHELAPAITLYHMDCCEFLEQYGYWHDHTTLFVDPPYVAQGQALYPYAFKEENHIHLAELLNALYTGFGGPDIILTYDDCAFIRELYPHAAIEEIKRYYSVNHSA